MTARSAEACSPPCDPSRSVLLCSSGLELLAAEAVLNAAIAAAKPIINRALGFALV